MKKVLLLSLSLVLGFCAFAQQRVAKNDLKEATASVNKAVAGKEAAVQSAANFVPQTSQSVVVNRHEDFDYAATMWTHYDLQSNQYVANRMYQLPNGSVAVAATLSHQPNQTASDRGSGYNFFNGEEWGEEPEERVEPFKTGWPSIAQWGENGEILLAHGNGHMQCFTRETAGEGEWVDMGPLPDYPEGYPYNEYPTWPRVITCGDNHNVIIAVAALQHSISSDESEVRTVIFRSEDATNWEVSYSPLEQYDYHINNFSADDYCLAADGHTVALLYSGCLTNSVWLFKSNDDGLNWYSFKVWENPYEGREFDEEPAWGMEDTLYIPMNGSVVVDPKGTVHVALNTFEMAHTLDNEPGYYTYYYGRNVDGILYWNDTQETPIQSEDGNPHHAARLWWPSDEAGYVQMHSDSTKWIGYIPMYEGYSWENEMYYTEEYHSKFYGASGHPALSCDPFGNLACAFSSPCTVIGDDDEYYYRHIYVSYRNVDEGYWHQLEEDITDPEEIFELWNQENMFTCAVPSTVNPGEFWFSFQSDPNIGLYWGSEATQEDASENTIYVIKVIADPELVSVPESYDAVDVITGIYPNPATDYVVVNSAMDADATITIVNLVGQTVKQFNKSLRTGENTFGIDLKSGIYFCTISANGFNKTIKLVVK